MSDWSRILQLIRPLQPLLTDPTVTEVMVNRGGREVFVERDGRLALVPGLTLTEEKLSLAVQSIARACDKEIDDRQPLLEVRLEDGSRVAAALRGGGSPDGAVLTIRRFTRRYSLPDLVAAGSLPEEVAARLARAVVSQKNILISGGTGTGKTTLLNALAATIPTDESERVFLIEDTSEIYIDRLNLVRFEAREALAPSNNEEENLPAITITQLLKHTLRHRPDRILLGEVRGAEAWDLLQALNTGHLGSMSTIHANNAVQALIRMAHCVMQANKGLPLQSTKEAISLAIHVVVHIARLHGRRYVTEVIAVDGFDEVKDKFVYQTWYARPSETEGAFV